MTSAEPRLPSGPKGAAFVGVLVAVIGAAAGLGARLRRASKSAIHLATIAGGADQNGGAAALASEMTGGRADGVIESTAAQQTLAKSGRA